MASQPQILADLFEPVAVQPKGHLACLVVKGNALSSMLALPAGPASRGPTRASPVGSSEEAFTAGRAAALLPFLKQVVAASGQQRVPWKKVVDEFPPPCGIVTVAAATEDISKALTALGKEKHITIFRPRNTQMDKWYVQLAPA